jgi:hypothetical protein
MSGKSERGNPAEQQQQNRRERAADRAVSSLCYVCQLKQSKSNPTTTFGHSPNNNNHNNQSTNTNNQHIPFQIPIAIELFHTLLPSSRPQM